MEVIMAYSIVRARIWRGVGSRFKSQETDTDFEVAAYTALDDYLSTMEQRGWNVVCTTMDSDSFHLLITLHQPDSPAV